LAQDFSTVSNTETVKPSTTGTDFSITLPYFPDPQWIPTFPSFPGKWSPLVNQIEKVNKKQLIM